MSQGRPGRLKIFLGYAAGVGKTYNMLETARLKKSEGKDVVIGVVLTHGRKDTEKLLEGLEVMPLAKIPYKGVELTELDLDGVLKRHPEIVIIDELAHTNVPGSRHTKRYMDVEELLRVGIDVYSTLNIQHLESFQDPIEQATGIAVRERVPDTILEEADEVELVDLPPEDLLERLRQGKVYVPDQAARAIHKFFKRENLQLLREIALRKTAAIVDTDRSREISEGMPQQVAPKLLASIGPSPFSERVIRVTKRLADMLHAEWIVASVAIPEASYQSDAQIHQINKNFHLAEELGATIVNLPGESIADTIFQYAKSHGVTQIVLGHSLRPWFERLFLQSPVDALVRKDGAIDIYVISSGVDEHEKMQFKPQRQMSSGLKKVLGCIVYPLILVSFMILGLLPFMDYLQPATLAVTYLFFAVVGALTLPMAGFFVYICTSMYMLDIAFLPDIDTWPLQGESFLFAAVSFAIGLLVNRLVAKQRRLATAAVSRHQETLRLFELSRDLAGAATPKVMLQKVNDHLHVLANARAILYLKLHGIYEKQGNPPVPFDATEQMAAHWTVEHVQPAGHGTETLPSAKGVYFPLVVTEKCLGSLGIYPLDGTVEVLEHRDLLEALTHLMALSIDRSEALA